MQRKEDFCESEDSKVQVNQAYLVRPCLKGNSKEKEKSQLFVIVQASWDFKCMSPSVVHVMVGILVGFSWMLGTHSTYWASTTDPSSNVFWDYYVYCN